MLELDDDHRELDGLLRSVLEALHSRNVELSCRLIDELWARLALHIRAEHLHLFPAILSTKAEQNYVSKTNSEEAIRQIIADLRHDHDFFMRELSDVVKYMRDVHSGRVAESNRDLDECRRSINDLNERLINHNRIEEEQIYPLASERLNLGEKRLLSMKIRKELENLPPRIRKIKGV